MNCKAATRLISVMVDGELAADKAAALGEHIASCDTCRRQMAEMKHTMKAIGAYGDIEPSFTLAGIRERAAHRGLRNPLSAWPWGMPRVATVAMVIAALALGSVSGIHFGSRSGSRAYDVSAVSAQHVSDSFGLDAFDDGLAGAMYVADAQTQPIQEMTR